MSAFDIVKNKAKDDDYNVYKSKINEYLKKACIFETKAVEVMEKIYSKM